MRPGRPIRVLVVDDSAIVRRIIKDSLDAESDIEVVGVAPDPYVARDKILKLEPDVLTLDIEMPRMDGLTFLQKLMRYRPLPVIVISSVGQASCQTATEALRLGALEVLAKPSGPYSVGELRSVLAMKIRAVAGARLGKKRAQTETGEKTQTETASTVEPVRYAKGTLIAIGGRQRQIGGAMHLIIGGTGKEAK